MDVGVSDNQDPKEECEEAGKEAQEAHAQPHDAWGQEISQARKAELDDRFARQREWVEQPPEARDDSVFTGVHLTGADVFWLAQRALVGPEADHQALEDAASRLRVTNVMQRKSLILSALHLEGASLGGAHLERANLVMARLEGASLDGAHLEGASLGMVHLEDADLRGAHLERADLSDAHLERADLFGAHLEGTDLRDAHLERADLFGAHLEGANLSTAYLEDANLRGAHLEDAYLGDAHLEGADLRGAHLERADLRSAHLEGADLSGSWLERADLSDAHLEGADLRGAHLEGANLSGSWLEGANLSGSWLDNKSLLVNCTIDDGNKLGDIQWSGVGAVNLTRLPWENVPTLGDEQGVGLRASSKKHTATVRAYRQLAAQLRAQGLSEVADRFAYRAQIRQRYAYLRTIIEDWRRPWRLPGDILRYLGSATLALLAGYGYRPGRTIILYIGFITLFAVLYFAYGTGCHVGGPQDLALILAQQLARAPQDYACVTPPAQPMSWSEALVVSLTAFHGRGFLATDIKPSDPQAAIAAAEAVLGLIIEISFIATFTQRFFGAK